ncbi:MAG: tellurite resistance TerB family protein [Parvularcula sp.]
MFDKILNKLFTNEKDAPPEKDKTAVAFAALLVEAAVADESYTEEEKQFIDKMIAARFDDVDPSAIRAKAEKAQSEASDMYQFSRVVRAEMDRDALLSLIEDMWVIALSDEERTPYEEMVIRRLIGLLYIEDTESTAARRRAELRLAAQ